MKYFLTGILLLLISIIVLLPVTPVYQPIPGRDQGVYFYIGRHVAEGSIPYRDIWDHKGPLIYYINAAGILMTGSTWGIWFIEVAFLFVAAMAEMFALQTVFDQPTAMASTLAWLCTLAYIIDHGNTVEEYSLLFQFAGILFFLRSEKYPEKYWNEWMIGVTGALTFSLRPNNMGIHLAIGLTLLMIFFFEGAQKHALLRIAFVLMGASMVLGGIGVYFALNHALEELVFQVFKFNLLYSKAGEFSWLSLVKGFTLMKLLVGISIAGAVGALANLIRKKDVTPLESHFAILALIVVPIQVFLSLLSGRKYMHYYIAWLPMLALLTGFFIFSIRQISKKTISNKKQQNLLHLALTMGLILAFGMRPVSGRLPKLQALSTAIWNQKSLPAPEFSSDERGFYVEYLLENTEPDDYVLFWGNESVYNYLANRNAPSRFVYTYAFGMPGYVTQEMADELITELIHKKPLIIDATIDDKTIPGIDSDRWENIPASKRLIQFIEEHYTKLSPLGPMRFRVWVPN